MRRPLFWIQAFAILSFVLAMGLLTLRLSGMAIPYKTPSAGMAPAIETGDQVLMEGFTYLRGTPQRGDIVTFRTSGIREIYRLGPSGGEVIFVQRIVGLPGETLRIDDGKLYVNGEPVSIRNEAGEIRYANGGELRGSGESVTVPAGQYYVLGDNTHNSYDSREWGCVPREAITGRVIYCYAPRGRRGPVK